MHIVSVKLNFGWNNEANGYPEQIRFLAAVTALFFLLAGWFAQTDTKFAHLFFTNRGRRFRQ